ncbi:SurA N-terminal domain-containing protein [Sinorhizobium meliloti]|uniref:Parvulin-like PPIase n=4 Tax=Rhizobium meliloti TaxID=382 RepID=F7X8U9_SINMM|nr:peptidylprolyl isomerase [Sinorhizobium meliloti]PST25644.1 peptidylprolyl isomerase [Mesorhizobium loti]TWB05067.1 peptidyl-prolyl cis-trans isomerase D [Ensifer sp. SEMIA 134]TWB39224.1 peptidyl-prolyl cis-trans isomerase D [Ensifer sp. SEMIA 135]AEG04325.1 putative peptidyl-prolyl cis-trans isomerase protein [Sinorhizobium meliloti BL225C]AEG53302.1 putative peptidyl-prolyl cis-trans isomerase protein [Sinorhizobium meliloti AK83]
MLDSLRNAAQTRVVKGLLALLILSFMVWGGQTLMVPNTPNAVVTVGDVKVSASDFRLAYERQVALLSRQLGTPLSRQQAQAFGVENQVYAQLVAGAALDQLATDMNLGLSEDRLARLIGEDPAFHGANGQFDRLTFSSVLRNAGLTEQDYINNRSQVAVRSQIVDALTDGYTAPKVLVDAIGKYRHETRTIDYLLLSNANIDAVKTPGDDVLAPWFESRKANYRAPEYRKISYIKLEPEDLAAPDAVTSEELRADYEKRKESYRTPATRTVEQLTFPSREAADAAAAKLAAGTSFDDLVKAEGKTSADVLLGDFTKERMPDAKIADAAFAVAQDGGTTPVVEGAFGPVILRVTNIRPDAVRSFDEVKEELRKEIALDAAREQLVGLHDKIEDERAGGVSVKEIAEQLKLKLVTVDAVDASGKDQNGDEVKDLPEPRALLQEVFKADVGTDTLAVNIGRDGSAWFDVEEIIPARDRTLDEVRDEVAADWTAEQQRAALAAKAKELKERIEKGAKLADIASELGLVVESKTGLTRATNDATLSPAAVIAAFAGPNGHVANAPGIGGDGQVLMQVTAVEEKAPADALDNDSSQIEAIARASGDDILDQMVSTLQTAYGVSINQSLAETALAQR